MRRAAIVAAMGLLLTAAAAAAQVPPPPPPPPVAPPPTLVAPPPPPPPTLSPILDLQVTPRLWYVSSSLSEPIRRGNPLAFSTLNGTQFILGGGVVSLRFADLKDTTFVVSGLYGTNDPGVEHNQFTLLLPGATFLQDTTSRTERFDLEFLAQTVVPDTNWGWILGARVEHQDNRLTARSAITSLPGVIFRTKLSTSGGNYTGKAGVAGALPLSADGRLKLFGNAMIVAGASVNDPGSDFGIVGPEGAIGVQYTLGPTVSVDLRYRSIVYYLFGVPNRIQQFTPQYVVQHGPMLGLTVKF